MGLTALTVRLSWDQDELSTDFLRSASNRWQWRPCVVGGAQRQGEGDNSDSAFAKTGESARVSHVSLLVAAGLEPGDSSHAKYQQRKLHMLKGWRDAVERQLAAANAAIATLEQQIERDSVS